MFVSYVKNQDILPRNALKREIKEEIKKKEKQFVLFAILKATFHPIVQIRVNLNRDKIKEMANKMSSNALNAIKQVMSLINVRIPVKTLLITKENKRNKQKPVNIVVKHVIIKMIIVKEKKVNNKNKTMNKNMIELFSEYKIFFYKFSK